MPWYPLPLLGYDRKPESRARLALNEDSPYRRGLAFDWVAGDTQYLDAANVAMIGADSVAPKKAATREGLIARFANGVLDALLLGEHTWIDKDKPFSLAFRVLWQSQLFNQLLLIKTVGGEPLQLIFSTDASYSDMWLGSFDGVTWPRSKAGTGFAPAGQWNSIVITFDGVNSSARGSYRFYSNGVVRTPVSGGASSTMPNENRLGRTDGAAREFHGDCAGVRFWENRCLPASLALEQSRRYWAPFQQPISYRADYPRHFFVPAAGAGAALVRAIPETLQAAEASLRSFKLSRTQAANLNLAGAGHRTMSLARFFLETNAFIEGSAGTLAMNRLRGETTQLSQSVQSVRGLVRLEGGLLQLAETRDRVLGFVRSVSETLQLTEVLRSVLGFVRSASEALEFSEDRLRFLGLTRPVAEILRMSEAIARDRSLVRLSSALVQVDEGVRALRVLVRLRNATLWAIEAAFGSRFLARFAGETSQIGETSPIARGFAQVAGETLSIVESALASTVKGVIAVLCGSISILAAVGSTLFLKPTSAGGLSIKPSSDGKPDAPDCDEKPES